VQLGIAQKIFIVLGAASVAATMAHAAERVTLRNGFALRCDHFAEVAGHVRLYPTAGSDSYIELAPAEIAATEWVADPLPEPNPSAPSDAALAPADAAANPGAAHDQIARPAAKAIAEPTQLSAADLKEILAKAGGAHNIDVDLLASVVKAESGGNARAVSRTGARGLMQLMPGTAAELGVQDSFRPDENVRGGSAYLDSLLVYYHENLALALAAYNAGPGAVDRYHGIPPYHETQAYVARVIHEFNRRVRARRLTAQRVQSDPEPAAQPLVAAALEPVKGTR
jgi:soluble lytic murein transglycosylase-like protein